MSKTIAAIAERVEKIVINFIDKGGKWPSVASIASVIGAEAMNTALEKVVDLASPEWHETAGQAKDAAAAAVLIISLGAAAVGAIIFLPKL